MLVTLTSACGSIARSRWRRYSSAAELAEDGGVVVAVVALVLGVAPASWHDIRRAAPVRISGERAKLATDLRP
jgi:hypothetical protein